MSSVSRSQIRRASRLAGIPEWLLIRQVRAESGGQQGVVSPRGASGVEQLMPGTARTLEQKYHVNTKTPFGNLLAGAYYLKEQYDAFGRWDYALAAYNAGPSSVHTYHGVPPYRETQDYVRKILHGETPGTGAGSTGLDSSVAGDVAAPAPTFTPQDAASHGLQGLAETGNFDPTSELRYMLRAEQQAQTQAQAMPPAIAATPQPTAAKWDKFVSLGSNADRAGVATQPAVLEFVGQIGRLARRKLNISTGSNHNEFVVGTQRQSDHWIGRAADISASGTTLTRLGRFALIAAGMPRAQAMRAKGGLFNVGRYQIIFNTHEGGNHFNHLHVGVR